MGQIQTLSRPGCSGHGHHTAAEPAVTGRALAAIMERAALLKSVTHAPL